MTGHHFYYTSFHTSVHSNIAACAPPTADVTPAVATTTPERFRVFGGVNFRHISIKATPPQPLRDKEEPLSVVLKGPVGGSLAFAFSPAFGQDSVQQPRGPVSLGLGGQGWKRRDLGPPCLDVVLILALPPSSSSSPPQRLSTGGQRGNNKHRGTVYSSWPKFHCELTRRAPQRTLCGGCVFMWGEIRGRLLKINAPPLLNIQQKTHVFDGTIFVINKSLVVSNPVSLSFLSLIGCKKMKGGVWWVRGGVCWGV